MGKLETTITEQKRLVVKVSTAGTGTPFIKQAPNLIPAWENCDFFINQPIAECDIWIVYGGLLQEESVRCAKEATIFITNEPPSVRKFEKKFTDQFGTIVTCHGGTVKKHPHIIYEQQALPWWVGHKVKINGEDDTQYEKTYDQLQSIPTPQKTKLISVIASNKRFTKGHRLRDDFIAHLKKELGDIIDIYGIGNSLVEDKWDAIAPYKYHIVIENSVYDDYWTEKITDCFLGESYAFYYGAPNLDRYFSKNIFRKIDIRKPEAAVSEIRSVLQNAEYESAIPFLKEAKKRILDIYQFFPFVCKLANTHASKADKILITLAPPKNSSIVQKAKALIRPYLQYVKRK